MTLKPIVTPLLFLAIFTGQQGGLYVMKNRLQELGIAASILLFLVGAWFCLFTIKRDEWQRWFLKPIVLTVFIIATWSLVFAFKNGTNALYSFFAMREFFFILLCPAIYFMWQSGYDIIKLRRLIALALSAVMLNYLFFYSTMDLEAAFFSSDPNINSLITLDPWRGFRLKPPLFSIMVVLMMSLMMLLQRPSKTHVLVASCLFFVGAYIWSIVLFRSTLATMLLSVLIYPFLLKTYSRLPLMWLAIMAGVLIAPIAFTLLSSYADSAGDSAGVRLQSSRLAIGYLQQNWLLGAGQASAYSITYQQLLGPKFFPSDLGLLGVSFRFGLLGMLTYLAMHFYILHRLWRCNWRYQVIVGKHEPLLWGLFMWMCAQTFNLALNPGLAYGKGITVAAIALALCAIYQQMLQSGDLAKRRAVLARF